MKRILIYFGLFFLLLVFLIGFFTVNITFFINHPYLKEKLRDYLESNHQVRIDYHHISIDLIKLHLVFQDFKLEHPNFSLVLPKAKVDFDWSKLLKGSYFPEELHISFPAIKLSMLELPEEEIEFDYKAFLQKIAPISLVIRKGDLFIEYKGNSFQFKELNLRVVGKNDQLVFNLDTRADLFSKLSLKGYLNYLNLFGEGELEVKELRLKQALKLFNLDVDDGNLNLQAQISLEKDKVYAGFSGDSPYLFRLKDGEAIRCHHFKGLVALGKDGLELEFPVIEFISPKVKGELKIVAKEGDIDFYAKANSLDFNEISPVLAKFLAKEDFKAITDYLKGGKFSDVAFQAKGKTWDEVFSFNSIKIVGDVRDGSVEIPETLLSFSGVEGRLNLERGKLRFEGRGILNQNIQVFNSKVLIDLRPKEPWFDIRTQFLGLASSLKELAISLVSDLSLMEKYEMKGYVDGSFAMSGPTSSLDIAVSFMPRNVELSFEPLKSPIKILFGRIDYKNERLSFSGINLNLEEGGFVGLEGLFELKSKLLSLSVSQVSLPKGTLFNLLSLDEGLKKMLETYSLDLEEVYLKDVFLKPLPIEGLTRESLPNVLLQNLSLSGRIKGLSTSYNFNNETISLSSPELLISFREGVLSLEDSLVKIEDSEFKLSGFYEVKGSLYTLRGEGEVKSHLYEKFAGFVSLPESVKLRLPAKLTLHNLKVDKKSIASDFSVVKDGARVSIQVKRDLGSKDIEITSRFEGNSSDFWVDLYYDKGLRLYAKGYLSSPDLLELLDGVPIKSGRIFSDLSLNIKETDLKSIFSIQKEPLETLHRLLRAGNLFLVPSTLKTDDLVIDEPLALKTTFSAVLDSSSISISNFKVKSEGLDFNGSLIVKASEKGLEFKGKVFSELIDLSKVSPIKEKNKKQEEKHKIELAFPIDINIDFYLQRLILPTNHTIDSVNGSFSIINGTLYTVRFPVINFCGLSFYAEAERNKDFHYAYIELNPSQGNLLDLFSCLYPTEMPKVIFEGPFKAKGFLYFDGEKDSVENSYGEFFVISRNGYMYRAPVLASVLGFLSPIDLFRGKIPDLERNLLPLDELTLNFKISNSYLLIDEFSMSAQGFRLFSSGYANLKDKGISLTFLVSPFKTVDVIIEHIPYLSRFLLGRERMLVYLPLEVVGTYDNPTIIPLHPASIGKGIFRFVFKFFGISEDFFQKKPEFEKIRRKDVIEGRLENHQGR